MSLNSDHGPPSDLAVAYLFGLGRPPRPSKRLRVRIFFGFSPPAGQSRADRVIQALVMNDRPAFERRSDETDLLFNVQVVVGQLRNVKALRRTALKNQVGRAVVINKLPDVAALLAERT